MNANYSLLISRLDGVRSVKPRTGQSHAANTTCPACDGKNKLSVAVTDDGLILIHCHKCGAGAGVAAAVGMDAADLFPPHKHHGARLYKKVSEWVSLSATSSQLRDDMFLLAAMLRYRHAEDTDLSDLADEIVRRASEIICIAKTAMRGVNHG